MLKINELLEYADDTLDMPQCRKQWFIREDDHIVQACANTQLMLALGIPEETILDVTREGFDDVAELLKGKIEIPYHNEALWYVFMDIAGKNDYDNMSIREIANYVKDRYYAEF